MAQEMWSPSSWQSKPNPYPITYEDQALAHEVLDKISRLPALVTEAEVSILKSALREVALGKAIIWQGGDCAELFEYCNEETVLGRIKMLSQMGQQFTQQTNIPSLLIGRIAGQYGKPRNSLTEILNGVEVPKFYGDNINDSNPLKREPNPLRLTEAYFYSSATLNRIRAALSAQPPPSIQGTGFGQDRVQDEDGLSPSSLWCQFVQSPPGISSTPPIFTSHEALYLQYEQAMTRPWGPEVNGTMHSRRGEKVASSSKPGRWYNSSAHFVWIGDKTRQLDGAHVEYFRALENPIGVKLGPSVKSNELIRLLDILDPQKETGKVTLITRLGSDRVYDILGNLIDSVQRSGHCVVWQCDPMHGNTRTSESGIRTRDMLRIFNEIRTSLEIHRQHGSWLGGIHLEMTPDDVVECTGGIEGWVDADLGPAYKTKCDPRLNESQSMEIVHAVAKLFRKSDEPYFRSKL
ncbi:3-deoxy-7-phosphoheptulonate synthase [Lojkania enalia]|uniref:Phospho-2-dehydro-3-deoxyheptonate aldolase n=1 Tax=Lojkania enalia TaxID=147567 RepID=A0A9P4MY39_9PLEO|nr:3-deoxy-7-phosphoheptulonate synthase [Didymosphaeria enalia]